MRNAQYICDKIATDVVYDQFEKLVSPGHYASIHFDVDEWDIEKDIRRVLSTNPQTQYAPKNEYFHAIVKGKLLWDFLIGKQEK